MTDTTEVTIRSDSTTATVGPQATTVVAGAAIGPPGTAGAGATLTVQVDDTTIDATVGVVDFLGADFAAQESPEDEINLALTSTSVVSGSYGSSSQVAIFTVDAKGRLTSASNVTIGSQLVVQASDSTVDATVGVLDFHAGEFDLTESPEDEINVALTSTSVVAGSYGTTSTWPSVTVDAKGRVTSASNVTAPTLTVQVDDTTIDATVTTIDLLGSDLAAQESPEDEINLALTSTSVVAGSYGTTTTIPTFTVDAKGRLTSASNLTPDYQGGWISAQAQSPTYSSADSPTFVIGGTADFTAVCGVGWRVKLTQSATVRYFIVTAVTSSTLTLYGGTSYTLANETITAFHVSPAKVPLGFNVSPTLWTVTKNETTTTTTASPTSGVWYNHTSISIPIGQWDVDFQCVQDAIFPAVGGDSVENPIPAQRNTLSTANNSESDSAWTSRFAVNQVLLISLGVPAFSSRVVASATKFGSITTAANTTYYMNQSTTVSGHTSIATTGAATTTVIRARCAYL